MIYCLAILRQKYLRKLVATVDVAFIFVVVVFAQFIRPQIVVQLRLQLCVTGCGREYLSVSPPLALPDDISIRNPMKRMLYWPNGADEGQPEDGGGWTERPLSRVFESVSK